MRKQTLQSTAALLALVVLLSGLAQSAAAAQPEMVAPLEGERAARLQPDWTRDAVLYEVNIRQYTEEGSFEAFRAHLQTLRDMGVTVLWFMPIHPISRTNRAGSLGSYYSVTDYRAVNPEFGTAEDFARLVEEAHSLGFHVMLDWVANHTGWDCPWITEHPEWYTQDESGAILSPANMGWPDVADLNYDNMDMRAEMIACMRYWVEEYDIDGFRCDYANGVPTAFWEAARAELETVKPVYMLAEDNHIKELLQSAFDFNYNWGLYDTLIAVAKGAKRANTIKLYIPEDFPDGAYTLNFLDNHDKNSYENTIVSAFGYDAIPALFSLIYTLPGAPLLYTGDEIGLDHALAFMDKDAVDWQGASRDYRALLSRLAAIRSGHPALWCGNFGGEIRYIELGNKNVFAFSREKDGDTVLCLFNLSKREQTVELPALFDGSETVLLYGQGADTLRLTAQALDAALQPGEITLQPWEFYITVR